MYSEMLTLGILEAITYLPPIALSILFWQYTNRQMFERDVIDTIEMQDTARLSHHTISDIVWADLTTSNKCLIISIIIMIVYHIIRKVYEYYIDYMERCGCLFDHNIGGAAGGPMPNFFDAL